LRGQSGDIASLSAEPYESFIFKLELEGQVVAKYTECFGLGSSNDIEEAVVQTDSGTVKRKSPGVLDWHNITLKRLGPSSDSVWSYWRRVMEDGKVNEATRDGAIIMCDAVSEEALARWNFDDGWPASLKIEGSIEELTIVHEGLQRVPPNFHVPREPSR
jgi:phage tail-like protein